MGSQKPWLWSHEPLLPLVHGPRISPRGPAGQPSPATGAPSLASLVCRWGRVFRGWGAVWTAQVPHAARRRPGAPSPQGPAAAPLPSDWSSGAGAVGGCRPRRERPGVGVGAGSGVKAVRSAH